MKTITLILFLTAGVNLSFSQKPISNEYVVTTADRSTVYILDDPMGRLIYTSWQTDPLYNGFKPNVVLVDNLKKYRRKVNKKNNNYDNRTSSKGKE
ncbi:hypothetical protein UFOVP972_266 [uncultured Caudovirales phage]|uniref:Uncharacterized protein n=1 Tax=uncultured Caudovirales phage TaxID=2100421 RepID=A0A6J5PUK3_9CAUD|nr:hypothetical protein UFOVP972_266 [uncultured Caudovirales phage]